MMKITINGKTQEYDGDPAMPLLWYIRDDLKMTGTKYGCGMALCGACTVHLDGQATRSCQLPMSAADGKTVTTIEGLDENNAHPLQISWAEEHVPQCGYCQSGQIMQAASLLASNPSPDDADIERAMSGNICRCGTYPRIKKAIKKAAEAGK
ncbi:(2Fe-2S)-binding protein [Alteromonas sp. RKMC-009]|uniref:(2Fe-2S)-binding protein n=1 Tax=Alteromonas sp. RKMC-009 TaxID=2267264 RepID=UPI000C5AA1FF|nr:(2Fe-2S)-binding protein [Alteromonas sp. RKMC-009]AYA66538.1 (2Fe-2S)-binding protein [Alteromonas sp. RKMC-009]MBT80403.1 (2Fe-2S)-binding protein [Alteromonadaceae bacterium]